MTDVATLGERIIARLIATVPALGGRVYDRATATTPFPYATIGPIYGVQSDVECVTADEWTIQVDLWDQRTKLDMAALAEDVRAALKGWVDPALTMHPATVGTPRIMADPDGQTVHGIVFVEALIENG